MPSEAHWRRTRREQWTHQAAFRTWGNAARMAYAGGVTALWIGVALALVPPGPIPPARAALCAGATVAAVFEVGWTLVSVLRRPRTSVSPPVEQWPSTQGLDPFDLR
jgi:hypothetical protein